MDSVIPLFPEPGPSRRLNGLYLETDLREMASPGKPFVYTNFVTSLDGRISVRSAGVWQIPQVIRTPQDRRLYQELSAQADVILVTARHARALLHNEELQPFPFTTTSRDRDLRQWRVQQGRTELPAIAVVCHSLDFSGKALRNTLGCPVYCVTGGGATAEAVTRMQNQGVSVTVASGDAFVPGASLIKALAAWGFELVYSVAGPALLNTLLRDKMLNRFYLTQVEQLAGGSEYRTFLEAGELPAVTPALNCLWRYQGDNVPAQMFSVYDFVYP